MPATGQLDNSMRITSFSSLTKCLLQVLTLQRSQWGTTVSQPGRAGCVALGSCFGHDGNKKGAVVWELPPYNREQEERVGVEALSPAFVSRRHCPSVCCCSSCTHKGRETRISLCLPFQHPSPGGRHQVFLNLDHAMMYVPFWNNKKQSTNMEWIKTAFSNIGFLTKLF